MSPGVLSSFSHVSVSLVIPTKFSSSFMSRSRRNGLCFMVIVAQVRSNSIEVLTERSPVI